MNRSVLIGLSVLVLALAVLTLGHPASAQTYAGSNACFPCHPEIYNRWEKTLHNKSLRDPATPDSVLGGVLGDFSGPITLSDQSVSSATIGLGTQTDGQGNTIYTATIGDSTYAVMRTYGGGSAWKQRYLTKIGNSYYILPMQWNEKTDLDGQNAGWVPYHLADWFDSDGTPKPIAKKQSFERRCVGCHSTGLEVAFNDTTQEYTATFLEWNTGCERCHGPGSAHLASRNKADIINPANLPPARAVEICGQCHSRGGSLGRIGGNSFGYPYSADGRLFMPGDPLADFYTNGGGDWPDGTSKKHHQQYLDLQLSGHGGVGLTCFSCHDPHGTDFEYDLLLTSQDNTLCLSCHRSGGMALVAYADTNGVADTTAIVEHTHHGYDPVNTGESRCTLCHMPAVQKSAVEYDIHSHTWEVLPPEKTLDLKMPNACAVSCHRIGFAGAPTFNVSDGEVGDWSETSDVELATILQGFYGPAGVWWSTAETFVSTENCQQCHAGGSGGDQFIEWTQTRHAMAYDSASDSLQQTADCLSCHTTGWDLSAQNGGADEFVQVDPSQSTFNVTVTDSSRFRQMANVQCEACHGPGSEHNGAPGGIRVDITAEACGTCHQDEHHPFIEEWSASGHSRSLQAAGGSVTENVACMRCHVAQNFLQYIRGEPLTVQVKPEPLTCVVCHDPHKAENTAQQRFPLDENIICGKCHSSEFAQPPQTPHHPQFSMLMGEGGYEYPEQEAYPTSLHATVATKKCATCHVHQEPFKPGQGGAPDTSAATGHTFEPKLAACQVCHPGLTTFNKDGVQTEIDILLETLKEKLEAASSADSAREQFAFAKFNYQFVYNDGSRGVHNSKYARRLLTDAIINFIPTSVELALFEAVGIKGHIEVRWQTASQIDHAGFNLYRATSIEGPFQKLNQELLLFSPYLDLDVAVGMVYFYQLGDVDVFGKETLHGPVRATVATPKHYALMQNYPNPFNPETVINYQLPKTGHVTLLLYNILGQQVRLLVDAEQPPGYYQVRWDGRNDVGLEMASGIYFYRLVSGSFVSTKKMMLMR